MKKTQFLFMFLSLVLAVMSCQKSSPAVTQDQAFSVKNQETLSFSSLQELQTVLNQLSDKSGVISETKSSDATAVDFVSYAETVMLEDGYDERPNALMSEVFGSVLNPQGEAYFGEYCLKLCDFGIIYSYKENLKEVRELSECTPAELIFIKCENCSLPLEPADLIYTVNGYPDIYVFNSFNAIDIDARKDAAIQPASSEELRVIYKDNFELFPGMNWNANYTVPKESEQKVYFPTGDKVANDTKFYQVHTGIYNESGVKVKTKKGIRKFAAPLFACIGGQIIREQWSFPLNFFDEQNAKSRSNGYWIEISTVEYNKKEYVIASMVSRYADYFEPMPNGDLLKLCNDAKEWASSLGVNVSKVDGIRSIDPNTKNIVVRLLDKVESVYDSKLTMFFNLSYAGEYRTGVNPLVTSDNAVSERMRAKRGPYDIRSLYMIGSSEYDSMHRGTQLIYTNKLN